MSAEEETDKCVECNGAETEEMVQCDKCDKWTHHACSSIPEDVVTRQVRKYYCTKCQDKFNLVHVWVKKTKLTAAEKEDKLKNYFIVEEIVNHSFTPTGRFFTIRWKGHTCVSKEPEKNLDGCLDLLQDYCIRKKIHLSKISGLLGASNSAKFDRRNWQTLDQIMKGIEVYRKMPVYKSSLEVFKFDKELDKDGIYLIAHDFHCFVGVYFKESAYIYLADGANKVEDRAQLKELMYVIGTRKRPVTRHFVGQAKADYCGSSAVLISLEFMRAHRLDILNSADPNLKASKWMRQTVVKRMHKFESASTGSKGLIQEMRAYNTCPDCGKKFIRNDKRLLMIHQRTKCNARAKEE